MYPERNEVTVKNKMYWLGGYLHFRQETAGEKPTEDNNKTGDKGTTTSIKEIMYEIKLCLISSYPDFSKTMNHCTVY